MQHATHSHISSGPLILEAPSPLTTEGFFEEGCVMSSGVGTPQYPRGIPAHSVC